MEWNGMEWNGIAPRCRDPRGEAALAWRLRVCHTVVTPSSTPPPNTTRSAVRRRAASWCRERGGGGDCPDRVSGGGLFVRSLAQRRPTARPRRRLGAAAARRVSCLSPDADALTPPRASAGGRGSTPRRDDGGGDDEYDESGDGDRVFRSR